MDTTLLWLTGSWLALAATLAGLMMVRKYMARQEDDFLHVSQATPAMLNTQAATAHRMNVMDRSITILLSAVIIYGVGIGALYLYQVWEANGTPIR